MHKQSRRKNIKPKQNKPKQKKTNKNNSKIKNNSYLPTTKSSSVQDLSGTITTKPAFFFFDCAASRASLFLAFCENNVLHKLSLDKLS